MHIQYHLLSRCRRASSVHARLFQESRRSEMIRFALDVGDEMLRVLCLMLLAGASVAHAGEHYR